MSSPERKREKLSGEAIEDQPQNSVNNILNLNDDCFEVIFKHLTPLDMCAVKDTCQRFKTLAETRMKSHYGRNEFILSNYKKHYEKFEGMRGQKKIVAQFGEFFKSIRIDVQREPENYQQIASLKFLTLIKFRSPQLDRLTLANVCLVHAVTLLEDILPNVKSIHLKRYYYNIDVQLVSFFMRCENVNEIVLCELNTQGTFLQQKFNQLQSLEIYGDVYIHNIKTLLQNNKNIKKLVVWARGEADDYLSELNIAELEPNIETLGVQTLNIRRIRLQLLAPRNLHLPNISDWMRHELNKPLYTCDVTRIGKLQKLKHLAVCCIDEGSMAIIDRLKENRLLRNLALFGIPLSVVDELCDKLCKLPHLKTLSLSGLVPGMQETLFDSTNLLKINAIKKIIIGMPTLENFSIESYKKDEIVSVLMFDTNDFLDMVAERKKMVDAPRLTIYLSADVYSEILKVIPRDVLDNNMKVIRLVEKETFMIHRGEWFDDFIRL